MQLHKKQPIGVFDSGVGGLSILQELRQLLPFENFVFVADQAYVPYGEKTKTQLIDRSLRIVTFLKKYHVKLIVVACNTATCYAIEALRHVHSMPIVGTVPAIKPAAEKTKTGIIGIIATPATSDSKIVKELIKNYATDKKVINISCPGLENAVEKGLLTSSETIALLEKYLQPIKISPADYLVLGCTHYPFLKSAILRYIDRDIILLDSGLAVAKQVKALLDNQNLTAHSKQVGTITYFTTGHSNQFAQVASKLLEETIRARTALL